MYYYKQLVMLSFRIIYLDLVLKITLLGYLIAQPRLKHLE